MLVLILIYMSCIIPVVLPPRQSSLGSLGIVNTQCTSPAPPLPPRTRRGTDVSPSPPRPHRPIGKNDSVCVSVCVY